MSTAKAALESDTKVCLPPSHPLIYLLIILTSDEKVSPEAINYRVSSTRNTQYSDLNTSIEYSLQIRNRNTQSPLLVSTGGCVGIPRMRKDS
eukprot:274045-Prorocentrum_minimum.AAC.1